MENKVQSVTVQGAHFPGAAKLRMERGEGKKGGGVGELLEEESFFLQSIPEAFFRIMYFTQEVGIKHHGNAQAGAEFCIPVPVLEVNNQEK